ncbi:hypothetical protein OEZ85_014084 [Tetradesmus obliquus]|uniref:GPI transamidase component PIG-T n=1 Tax=Tetradesmus obliquus TaxID=3088 RepID=A0ABY8U743_TETOB|nr:hypothetical protein OEZ85_014084 [Tetradesmus obliquus]
MCSRIWAVLVAVCLLLGSSSCHSAAAVAQQESYTEEAVVQPLANGLVLVHFQFTQTTPLLRHYTIFPKAVGQLVSASLFNEFQLSLTQGRWHYQHWGQPVLQAKPAGAEFVAKFSPLLPAASLAGQWGTLSHALGSLFCASLNFEASCTENLTPWLKLLPCRDAAGLGALLADRRVVFGADHHSMQVSMIVERNADLQPLRSTLTQSLTLVLRPPPGTHPATISSSGEARQQLPAVLADVNLSALLGNEVKQACPLAQQSRVYIRVWLHTLQLSIDGQRRSLDALLTHRHITPARDRTRPLVLNMCLALPAAATTLTLSAQFSKAFLTVAEYPPDAHRGFDVPAAQVTIGLTSLQTSGSSAGQQGDASSSSSSSWAWHVYTGDGAEAWQQQQLQQELPLMQALAAVRPVQVYSPSLVVPLAVPDFSMPYNVICLTSTVLAVLLGAVVGALLLRPAEAETQAHASSAASAAQKRRKRAKVVLLLAVFGGLGLYLDPSLQEALWEQLTALGLA